MKKSSGDRWGGILFAISLAFLSMLYGIVSSWWGWFPAIQIGEAHRTMLELRTNWRNDFGLQPTRHLVEPIAPRPEGEDGFTLHRDGDAQPGYILITGLNPDPDGTFHMVTLYDGTGQQVHQWPIRYDQIDPEGKKPQNVMLHGMEVFEDGSIVATFDSGSAITRLDPCGEQIWTRIGNFHHSIARDGQGAIVTWQDERVVWLDETTGEEMRGLDLHTDIIPAGDGAQRGYFDLRTVTQNKLETPLRYLEDPFHPNDAEPLTPDLADVFPMFEVGDVMISLRELNMIAVVDPDTGLMRWWQHGPWMKQHDPDFEPDGTISVYDNATGTGASKIWSVDPSTRELRTLFSGSEDVPFYSWQRGKHQLLENGNILLVEPEHGRALEVAPDGQPVWERHVIWDDTYNTVITEARHVPADFFENGVPSCEAVTDTASLVNDLPRLE
ncbi:arylsulfotransferase family protein [Thalassococcus sp. S3]|uniref:arylsulfotransferase family protein n=1 Tax=Thalassococcus sp. S3 TaxID=2017482 RepID=UPI0010242D15|nr:arylsulfotransferase family protein [Thalassococcus sp. S3]QBF30551.1 hypothetical protein CFI11_04900 [Thalassococcus sp. S3]